MSEQSQPVAIPFKGPDGKEKHGIPVKVSVSPDQWTEFKLEDGAILKTKAVIIAVFRIIDEFDEMGAPIYVSQIANFVTKDLTAYNGPRDLKEGSK